MFFDGWSDLGRVFAVGVPAYILLVVMLRLSGKRTLSKMNAFDIVVTVAIGSTLGSTLTSSGVSLAEGVAALGLLILLQFLVTWVASRSGWFNRMIKDQPTLVAFRGELLRPAMRRQRVTDDEVHAAVREAGLHSMDQVGAVVLQSSSEFAVIERRATDGGQPAVIGVGSPPERD